MPRIVFVIIPALLLSLFQEFSGAVELTTFKPGIPRNALVFGQQALAEELLNSQHSLFQRARQTLTPYGKGSGLFAERATGVRTRPTIEGSDIQLDPEDLLQNLDRRYHPSGELLRIKPYNVSQPIEGPPVSAWLYRAIQPAFDEHDSDEARKVLDANFTGLRDRLERNLQRVIRQRAWQYYEFRNKNKHFGNNNDAINFAFSNDSDLLRAKTPVVEVFIDGELYIVINASWATEMLHIWEKGDAVSRLASAFILSECLAHAFMHDFSAPRSAADWQIDEQRVLLDEAIRMHDLRYDQQGRPTDYQLFIHHLLRQFPNVNSIRSGFLYHPTKGILEQAWLKRNSDPTFLARFVSILGGGWNVRTRPLAIEGPLGRLQRILRDLGHLPNDFLRTVSDQWEPLIADVYIVEPKLTIAALPNKDRSLTVPIHLEKAWYAGVEKDGGPGGRPPSNYLARLGAKRSLQIAPDLHSAPFTLNGQLYFFQKTEGGVSLCQTQAGGRLRYLSHWPVNPESGDYVDIHSLATTAEHAYIHISRHWTSIVLDISQNAIREIAAPPGTAQKLVLAADDDGFLYAVQKWVYPKLTISRFMSDGHWESIASIQGPYHDPVVRASSHGTVDILAWHGKEDAQNTDEEHKEGWVLLRLQDHTISKVLSSLSWRKQYDEKMGLFHPNHYTPASLASLNGRTAITLPEVFFLDRLDGLWDLYVLPLSRGMYSPIHLASLAGKLYIFDTIDNYGIEYLWEATSKLIHQKGSQELALSNRSNARDLPTKPKTKRSAQKKLLSAA